jgi:hypothetical protein
LVVKAFAVAARKRQKTSSARARAPLASLPLIYKVVELNNVDENTLEHCLNEYSAAGWTLDGVQFAMRESSKRPSMAFVLFTRAFHSEGTAPRSATAARKALGRLAEVDETPVDAWQRLAQLADIAKEKP